MGNIYDNNSISRQAAIAKAFQFGLAFGFGKRYDEMDNVINEIKKVIIPQPKTGYISIDDVMSVFDDFMRGEVDENDTETFLEMLKDREEREK